MGVMAAALLVACTNNPAGPVLGAFLCLFAAIHSGQSGVLERGELGAPVADDLWIDPGTDHAFLLGGVSDDDAVGIDDEAATGVGELRIGAATVHPDDVGQVFDGAGLQQRDPMLDAFGRPRGDVDEYFGTGTHGVTGELGEAQVVADERGDAQALPLKHTDALARRVRLILAAHAEGVVLGVTGQHAAIGADGEGLIQATIWRGPGHNTTDDAALVLGGDVAQKLLGGAACGLGSDGKIHAEAGRKGFRQNDERSRLRIGIGDEFASLGMIRGAIFPDGIDLDEVNGGQGGHGEEPYKLQSAEKLGWERTSDTLNVVNAL